MLPECHRGSRFDGGILSEIATCLEALQRREHLLCRIPRAKNLEYCFDVMGAVQHRCEGCIDWVRYPRVVTFREQKSPSSELMTGCTQDLKRGRVAASTSIQNYPAQQQVGGNGLTCSS